MSWSEFQAAFGGLLIVGHGTRRPEGVQQLFALAEQLQSMKPDLPMEVAFLELAKPDIPTGLVKLRQRNVTKVIVVPILLFEAGHAKKDIPEQVLASSKDLGIQVLGQSSPIGLHRYALELSEERFVQALHCRRLEGCLQAGFCNDQWQCQNRQNIDSITRRVALAMVGRGTSDPGALDAMRNFTRLRYERNLAQHSQPRIVWCETGFFSGGSPSVDELLERAATSSARHVVVQPHLLFEGELMQQLRRKVAYWQGKTPHQQWLVAATLGQDSRLADTFLQLAGECLTINQWPAK